jgi:hypothetical protein
MQTSYNSIFSKQVKKLIPATRKKAIVQNIQAFGIDQGSQYILDISFVDNPQTIVKGVRGAKTLFGITINPGDRCVVDIFDETNSKDQVVVYVY